MTCVIFLCSQKPQAAQTVQAQEDDQIRDKDSRVYGM